jgi:large subunit ribosomal protein L31
MKKQGHPPYQEILFVDSSTGTSFICGSTLKPKEKQTYEGKEYPVYKVSVSSASHPFYTGSKQLLDSEGRVDKFNKRYSQKKVVEAAPTAEAPVTSKAPATKKTSSKKAK